MKTQIIKNVYYTAGGIVKTYGVKINGIPYKEAHSYEELKKILGEVNNERTS